MGISPSIAEYDGEYYHDSRKNLLQWKLAVVDGSNKQGAMEFSVPSSIPGDFFPVEVTFSSKTIYADLKTLQIVLIEDDTAVKHSSETLLYADKYEIV